MNAIYPRGRIRKIGSREDEKIEKKRRRKRLNKMCENVKGKDYLVSERWNNTK